MYVNYGQYEDFLTLKEMGIDVQGKLVIMRLGEVFRGEKIKNAERFGAIGAIIYT